MIDAERIKRLARWAGFAQTHPNEQYTHTPDGWGKNWNPLKNIQDATMLEDEVERRGLEEDYILALQDNLYVSGETYRGLWLMIHATPEQRCAAIEKLMEGGKE